MMYYFANGMEQRGPYSLEEMGQFGLRPDTLVWREGMENWQRMDSVPELMALIPQASAATERALSKTSPTVEPPIELSEPAPSAVAPSPAAPAAQWTAPQPTAAAPYAHADQYSLQYQSGMAPQQQASGMAIASLVLGIVSVLSFCGMHIGVIVGLPCAILAIVFGILARQKIERGEAGGRGMALAGIICGSIHIALLIIVAIIILIVIAAATMK
jgi:hypothetical protein